MWAELLSDAPFHFVSVAHFETGTTDEEQLIGEVEMSSYNKLQQVKMSVAVEIVDSIADWLTLCHLSPDTAEHLSNRNKPNGGVHGVLCYHHVLIQNKVGL